MSKKISAYDRVLEKIKNKTDIETISLTITDSEFIVNDTSKPECLLNLYNDYNVPCVSIGKMDDVSVNCNNLEDLDVLTSLMKVNN